MGLKQRVGNFLLLFGLIGLLIFAATVLTPPGHYDVPSFLAGALLFGLGLNFRLSKSSGSPHAAPKAAAAAPKEGPPAGGPPKPAAPKRQGLLSTILKGPPPKRTASPPKPGGGGPPPKKK